jgi:hypothetical protein
MNVPLRGLRRTDPLKLFNAADDIRDSQVYQTLERLEDLTNDDDYAWAHDTLTGIYSTIERSQKVTPGQLRAIENIENSRSNRRY